MWVTESEHYLDWYGWGAAEHTWFVYEDHLFSTGVGGIVYAYNIADGTTDWTYELSDAYNEPVTGLRWWGWITLIADGKVYVGTCEHSAEQPLPRGAPLVCLNASNGAEIWRVNGMYRATRWGGNAVMGDSIYATMDTYDQRIYAVGKGPSATTAVIENDVITEGDMALIKGMVTDISPGTEEYGLRARFPNGVPAMSDDNMSDWMLYVYKQFAKPADVVGVDVTVTVLDPNGNSYEVGTVTSDENGFYQLMFEPPVPGEYTVYATFCGSEAYWGSSTTTALGVLAAPEPTAPPTEPPADPTGTYVTGFGIGIIVVVVVIGLVIILMLRKR
jgi:outer membrane protein assembly factor BamB